MCHLYVICVLIIQSYCNVMKRHLYSANWEKLCRDAAKRKADNRCAIV